MYSFSLTINSFLIQYCSTHIIDNKVHDGFWYVIALCLVYNAEVAVHQVPDCLHLSLQLRVHRAHLIARLRTEQGGGGGRGRNEKIDRLDSSVIKLVYRQRGEEESNLKLRT